MLITEKFVVLHIPKTGGQWLAEVLEPIMVELGPGHGTWQQVPDECAALPQLAVVRNPWDWYVSWWHWWRSGSPKKPPPPDAQLAFDEALRAMRQIDAVTHQWGRYGMWFHSIVGPNTELIRFEHLREGMLAFLRSHDVFDPDLEYRVLTTPPLDASDRGHYSAYYDDASRNLVQEVSTSIIDRFGYSFEEAPQ